MARLTPDQWRWILDVYPNGHRDDLSDAVALLIAEVEAITGDLVHTHNLLEDAYELLKDEDDDSDGLRRLRPRRH